MYRIMVHRGWHVVTLRKHEGKKLDLSSAVFTVSNNSLVFAPSNIKIHNNTPISTPKDLYAIHIDDSKSVIHS